MEARELRTTSSLMTIVVLAGITGFLALVVLKNTLQARTDEIQDLKTKRAPRQAAHAFFGMAHGILLPQQWHRPMRLASLGVQGLQVTKSLRAQWCKWCACRVLRFRRAP